uniref:3-isopropylmalate dehydratase small subunit n=1 Tax=Candidatus Kentrum sp. TC TaxID=2126339 RepID=A0A450Y800_9GAMM|nr:MAG: 3-isopropylmalate dehydratase, small subunit [Candidatus Kentron sp. TC]VFK40841.1 MAG: 3-isopropylmalate/(R)-2-methylmalate dehydratase small subunit [Candidatus Kentron sp. TC]VFK53683.1 MAG: 3-isopropylmalate/(R)-2-methylmalate dehydratase small subunit [Candidatus Kentron sp. TC]
MEPFTKLSALVAPLDQANVDTDAIIPKQFLKSIRRAGFGPHAFDAWRYLDQGKLGQDCAKRPLNPDFSLNQVRYQGANILLTGANFGCGSSREHAPWALLEYGFRVIIASSFADIFYGNCFKSGILPVALDPSIIERLFTEVHEKTGYKLTVDLSNETVTTPKNEIFSFTVNPRQKYCLMNGLDEIGLTLEHAAEIKDYEARRRKEAPWLFSF